MKMIPIPVAEARKYLDGKMLERYERSFDSFYSADPCYGLIDFTLRELPKGCAASKDLAMKRYQIVARNFDLYINETTEQIKKASNPKMKSSLIETNRLTELSKKRFREETIREYGVDIPGC